MGVCVCVTCVCMCSAFVIERHTDRVLKVSTGKSLGFSLSVRFVVNALLFSTTNSVWFSVIVGVIAR